MPKQCEHNWLFIFKSKGFGLDGNHRYDAHVCRDCGTFHIFGSVNFVPFDMTFRLYNEDLIKAANQNLPFIDLPKDKPLQTFICYGCTKETLEIAGRQIIPSDTKPDEIIVRLYCKKCWNEFAENVGNTFKELKSKLD